MRVCADSVEYASSIPSEFIDHADDGRRTQVERLIIMIDDLIPLFHYRSDEVFVVRNVGRDRSMPIF
jgi:hypothetical protein